MRKSDFEQLYQRYFSQVYRYSLALTRDELQAEELTQETFFKALQAADDFRGESSLGTWLCSIARNSHVSAMRKQTPESLEALPDRSTDAPGPEEQALSRDESFRLHQALHALAEPYKEVFCLRVFAQLSFREIGALFGKTENWACVTYHRARTKLCMKEETR